MAYYVYELIDPRDGCVFYVGKGKGARVDAHEREARAGRVSRKCVRIREIEANGLSVVKRKVKTFTDEQDAYDFEERHIAQFSFEILTNVQPGGGAARNRPTISYDRSRVKAAAEMLNRLSGGRVKGIMINGQYLDLVSICDSMKKAVSEVAARRSLDWVNTIAHRLGVKFAYDG